MLALVKQKPGHGHVDLTEVPEPAPGPGQVKIRVEAAGVCGLDLHILHWDIKLNLQPPAVMGHELSGTVADVGDAVSRFAPGDRVTAETTFRSCGTCRHCRTGGYNLCPDKELIGYVHDGCFAPYCVVPAERVHLLPESVGFEEGALCEPLACCVHAVMEQITVQPGDTVVVAGVGAVGLLAGQVAHACGGQVIFCGTEADTGRFAVAQELGFERIIEVGAQDPVQAVGDATGAEGADVFLECSGAPAAARSGVALLRRGGQFCQVGLMGKPFELDFEQVAYKELRVTGSIGSKWTSWQTALILLGSDRVNTRLLAGEPLPLTEWKEAFRRFEAREGLKVLMRPE